MRIDGVEVLIKDETPKHICIIKNCWNPGVHKIRISFGENLDTDTWIAPEAREHDVYLCDEDFAVVDGVKYLAIEDTKL